MTYQVGRILLIDYPYDGGTSIEEESLPQARVEVVRGSELPEIGEDVIGLLIDTFTVDAHVLDRFPNLRGIGVTGVGLDSIDLAEVERRGIRVVNVPDGATEEVATHAIAMLLALVRRLPAYHQHVLAGGFDYRESGPIRRFSEQTVGLAGFGRIARAVATRLQPFGCRLVGWDPYVNPKVFNEYSVDVLALEELLEVSDAVSIHLPLNEGTRDLMNKSRLEHLKPQAIVVNTGRGKVLDTDALTSLLRAGRLGGVGLDVFRDEPPGEELVVAQLSHNVILTPHAAFYSRDSVEEIRRTASLRLAATLERNGQEVTHVSD